MNQKPEQTEAATVKIHNQKGRKNTVVVSFALDVATLAEIDDICKDSVHACKEPLTRSSWIKRALARELAHRERGRRCRRRESLVSRAEADEAIEIGKRFRARSGPSSIPENSDLTSFKD